MIANENYSHETYYSIGNLTGKATKCPELNMAKTSPQAFDKKKNLHVAYQTSC